MELGMDEQIRKIANVIYLVAGLIFGIVRSIDCSRSRIFVSGRPSELSTLNGGVSSDFAVTLALVVLEAEFALRIC